MNAASLALRRQTVLGATSLAGVLLAGCAAPSAQSPAGTLRAGAASRESGAVSAGADGGSAATPRFDPGGPFLERYTDARGQFPRAGAENWFQPRFSVDGFSRLDEILASRRSARPASPSPWRRAQAEISGHYEGAPAVGAGRIPFGGYLSRHPTTGLLIAQDDQILMERYQYARHEDHRFHSFSMAKTVIAMLIGIALAEGRIRSLDDPAQRYEPGLAGSAYGTTPIRHLLTMSSGVRFREDYDGQDDVARLSRGTLGGGPGGAQVMRQFEQRSAPPGQRWAYASGDSFALALVLRAAIAQPIATYFAERLWQPLGAQSDAGWLIDRSGQEVGFTGLNLTLRDWARLGMLLARHGEHGGRQLIPAAWVREATRAQFSGGQTGRWYGYGFQTWVFPDNDGSFALLGVRGQSMFIDPTRRLVMVHTAVRSEYRDSAAADTVALWRGLRAVRSL